MSFIEIKDITKNYQSGKTTVNALGGISLNIERGEYCCIIGPSGSGKSTLLNIIGLLDSPTSGELYFDNKAIHVLKDKELHRFRRKRISFIFQSFNLVPVLNVYENIEFPLLIQGFDKAERKERIKRLTEEVGIDSYLKRKPDELSGGQKQRVAITRALVTNPEVVLADEPTANLDSVTGNTILTLMRRLNKDEKITFLIASHDPIVMKESDRIINIIDGRVKSEQ